MNNYDKAIEKAAIQFKNLEHEPMAKKLNLQIDEDYIYVSFFHVDYKINRKTGFVFAQNDRPANFNEAMSLYDLLSFSKEDAAPSGSYCRLNSLHGISKVSSPMDGWAYKSLIEQVAGNEDKLVHALKNLCGDPFGKGDISYKLPLFKDLAFIVCYWKADDEFPAQMYFMYDENMTQYFKFETIWYVSDIIKDRLESEMNGNS